MLADIAACDEQIEALNTEIASRLAKEREIPERLEEIPGVNRKVGEVVVAELGTDMKRFGSASRAAGRSKGSYLGAQCRRLSARKESNRAAVAVGHSILTISYHMMDRGTRFQELRADYFDRRNPERGKDRLTARLEKLGYTVSLERAA